MKIQLKPVAQQVIVITGATSGIGRATALAAAQQGAHIVVASRDSDALDALVDELNAQGAQALAVPTDVGDMVDHQNLMDAALARFGHVDTWVNNAGVSVFGRLEDVPIDDQRQLFETNFWGVVYGSLVAARHLKKSGGALINLGSELSDVAVPLQGAYSASKHAVKGYTDALRMELLQENAPVSVTLIKPASINTAFVDNAPNYMAYRAQLPAPLYDPSVVAKAILFAAANPRRDIYVGSASKVTSSLAHRAPALLDKIMASVMYRQQRTDVPNGEPGGALHKSRHKPMLSASTDRTVRQHSAYTTLTTSGQKPALAGGALAAVLLVAGTLLWKRSGANRPGMYLMHAISPGGEHHRRGEAVVGLKGVFR